MLMPKKVKYRKVQRGRRKGLSKGALNIEFGEYGLRAEEPAWVTARQIESMRVALSRHLKKVGKFFLRVFPDKPVTKKPAEVRMGKGKGATEGWVAVIRPGKILYEMEGVPRDLAKEAFRLASHKLSVKTRFVERSNVL